MKFFKTFIYIILVAALFVTISSCDKSGQEKNHSNTTIPIAETKTPEITIAPTTTIKEAVTATTVEATTTTETEIINVPTIGGLKFDQATKTYIAEAGNPYGLEVGVEAGVYTPNILTIETVDGTPGNFDKGVASLDQAVITVLQAEALKEKGEYFFPLLVDVRNIDNLGLVELKMLPDQGFKSLGIKMPIGTELYSPIESSNFQLVYYKEMGYAYDETDLQTSFGIKTKNKNGFFDILTTGGNLLLENKIIKETKQKNNEGKEVTVKTVQLKFGDLIGKITSEEPLRLGREMGAIEDRGEQQLAFMDTRQKSFRI